MNRRVFLGAAAAWAAASAAEAATPADDRAAMRMLSDAWGRAYSAEIPLLILVIPADVAARNARGRILGAWVDGDPIARARAGKAWFALHPDRWADAPGEPGDEDRRAALGSVVWACASLDQLRVFAPAVRVSGEPWMILLDPSTVPVAARVVPFEAPPPLDGHESWKVTADTKEFYSQAHNLALTAALDAALSAWSRGIGTLDPRARAAAIARADAAAAADPPGAYWYVGGPCGGRLENVPDQALWSCGMGSVDALSSRFLFFFAADR